MLLRVQQLAPTVAGFANHSCGNTTFLVGCLVAEHAALQHHSVGLGLALVTRLLHPRVNALRFCQIIILMVDHLQLLIQSFLSSLTNVPPAR